MNQSIVITGMGAVTPIGIGVKAYWQALLDGACGITDIPDWQERQLAVNRAAEVKNFTLPIICPAVWSWIWNPSCSMLMFPQRKR